MRINYLGKPRVAELTWNSDVDRGKRRDLWIVVKRCKYQLITSGTETPDWREMVCLNMPKQMTAHDIITSLRCHRKQFRVSFQPVEGELFQDGTAKRIWAFYKLTKTTIGQPCQYIRVSGQRYLSFVDGLKHHGGLKQKSWMVIIWWMLFCSHLPWTGWLYRKEPEIVNNVTDLTTVKRLTNHVNESPYRVESKQSSCWWKAIYYCASGSWIWPGISWVLVVSTLKAQNDAGIWPREVLTNEAVDVIVFECDTEDSVLTNGKD